MAYNIMPLTEADIPIFDSPLAKIYDGDNYGYNLGDLLNAPYFLGLWPHNHLLEKTMLTKAALLPRSILYHYCQTYVCGEPTPNLDRLKDAVQTFIQAATNGKFLNILQKVRQPDVLCVHIRSGDRGSCGEAYKKIVRQMSKEFKEVVLLCGVHYDQQASSHKHSIHTLVQDINDIMHNRSNISVYIAEADMHIACMQEARHLLLHKTGFSIIGSLICKGKIYLTKAFEIHANWSSLGIPYTLL